MLLTPFCTYGCCSHSKSQVRDAEVLEWTEWQKLVADKRLAS
jgi:hypothetical protein